jgi:hypothetical protein
MTENAMPPFFGTGDAAKLSKGFEGNLLVEDKPRSTETDLFLPIKLIAGDHYQRANTPKLRLGVVLGDCTTIPSNPKPAEENKFPMAGFADQVRVPYLAQNRFSGQNNILESQILLSWKAAQYKFNEQLFLGDPGVNPNTIRGLDNIIPAGNVINLGGFPARTCDINALLSITNFGGPKNAILVVNSLGYRLLQDLAQQAGFELPMHLMNICGPDGRIHCVQYAKWDFAPVVVNDFAPLNQMIFEDGDKKTPDIEKLKKGVDFIIGPPISGMPPCEIVQQQRLGVVFCTNIYSIVPGGVGFTMPDNLGDRQVEVILNNDIDHSCFVADVKFTAGTFSESKSAAAKIACTTLCPCAPCVGIIPPPHNGNGDGDVEDKKKGKK